MNDLKKEWTILHSNIEKYEQFSLIIKLFSVVVFLISTVYGFELWLGLSLLCVLWLQDGIWKTFQKRLECRIEYIEQTLQSNTQDLSAFQLYSQWQAQRQGAIGLIYEYLSNSIKPTVAYPFIILIIIFFFANA